MQGSVLSNPPQVTHELDESSIEECGDEEDKGELLLWVFFSRG